MKIIVEKKKKKRGLFYWMHKRKKEGKKPRKPGEKGYPDKEQWDKLTKEELQEIISEEIQNIFEEEKEDPKAAAEQSIKDASKIVTAAEKEKRAQIDVNRARPPEQKASMQADLKSKIEQEKIAKKNLQTAKQAAEEIRSVTEQKSAFQKEMARKGKGWKVRLLTKGKQDPGSAYPNAAPMERSKSAPPGAGGS